MEWSSLFTENSISLIATDVYLSKFGPTLAETFFAGTSFIDISEIMPSLSAAVGET